MILFIWGRHAWYSQTFKKITDSSFLLYFFNNEKYKLNNNLKCIKWPFFNFQNADICFSTCYTIHYTLLHLIKLHIYIYNFDMTSLIQQQKQLEIENHEGKIPSLLVPKNYKIFWWVLPTVYTFTCSNQHSSLKVFFLYSTCSLFFIWKNSTDISLKF